MKYNNFSVLMSVYYKENPKYLELSLKSVFNQTKKPSEVILVEDGKLTDELYGVISRFEKKYVNIMKPIPFEKNRGLGKALHDGLLKCSYEIVFRMDTDDICEINRFEKQLEVFESKNVDVVGTNIIEYDETMKIETGNRIVPENDKDIKKWAKKRNPINHMTVAYKKSSVINSGNYQDMLFFEDYYLWARMINKGYSFYNIQTPLVNVRGGEEMIKRRGGKKYIKPIIKFQRELYKLKLINRFEYIINVTERIIVSLFPSKIRMFIYSKKLRIKVSN